MVYVAVDAESNSATCSFRLFVLREFIFMSFYFFTFLFLNILAQAYIPPDVSFVLGWQLSPTQMK